MSKKVSTTLFVKALLVCGIGTCHAGLVDRGGGLIYDDVLNITWMQDAQHALTSGYSASGQLNWTEALAFAQNVEYYDAARDVTWSDWRLPTALNAQDSRGFDQSGASSELAYMYYVNLGLAPNYSGVKNEVKNPWFDNLIGRAFWTGTADKPGRTAWEFIFGYGRLDTDGIGNLARVWLVRDGDVGVAASSHTVPEPGTLALFALGLGGVAFARRRRAR